MFKNTNDKIQITRTSSHFKGIGWCFIIIVNAVHCSAVLRDTPLALAWHRMIGPCSAIQFSENDTNCEWTVHTLAACVDGC